MHPTGHSKPVPWDNPEGGDGDSQEGIRAEGPSVVSRVSVVVENVDPALMTRDSCSEVLQ